MGTKLLTVFYLLVLIGIVFIADNSKMRHLLFFVYTIPYGDKLGHFFLMGILSFLINLAWSCKTVKLGKLNLLRGSLLVAVLVTVEEFSQLLIKWRTFDLTDLIFDCFGIFVFGQLAKQIQKSRRTAAEQ